MSGGLESSDISAGVLGSEETGTDSVVEVISICRVCDFCMVEGALNKKLTDVQNRFLQLQQPWM